MYFSGIISDAPEAFRICGKRQQKCAIVNEKNTIILEGSRDGTAGYCGRKGKSDRRDSAAGGGTPVRESGIARRTCGFSQTRRRSADPFAETE